MKKILLLLATILSLCSCEAMDKADNARLDDRANNVVYIKDRRTGLCYASYWGLSLGAFANVPCNPEVEKLIKK